MKLQALIPALFCLLAISSFGETRPVLRVLGPPGPTEPLYHVIGGQSLNVEMVLESPARVSVEIEADLFQKAQSLLAPVKKAIAVGQIPASSQGNRSLIAWTLPTPAVERETLWIARLKTRSKGSEWVPSDQIAIRIYPVHFAQEELVKITEEQGLSVFGSESLRKFLDVQNVKFEEIGRDLDSLPDHPGAKSIYVGEATSRQLSDWVLAHPGWPARLVVFCSDAPLLPGVFSIHQNGIRIVKVTLPILAMLSSDPLGRKTFLEILKMTTAL